MPPFNKILLSFTLPLVTLVMTGCSSIQGNQSTQKADQIKQVWQADKSYQLTVLHTNDNHGRFWTNKYGEYGMPARKTLIDSIRAEVEAKGGSVLLLSGGDINTGVPESDLQNAEPDFKGMSAIGYDAMAVGNHEFDNSLEVLKKQEEWANFPMLSANIYSKDSNKRLFAPYQVFYKQGIKVAIIGLTTEDTKVTSNPKFTQDLEFRDPKEEAKKVIAELKNEEKPDLIFAVTHMGHYQNGEFGVNAPGDVSLARYLNEGDLDMIIGGHSQEPVCTENDYSTVNRNFKAGNECVPDRKNGTWIVQAHEWGKYLGRADYTFKNGVLTLDEYQLIPVNLKKKIKVDGKKQRILIQPEIKANKELYELLAPYQEKGQKKINIEIAETNGKLEGDRNVVRFGQTNLGYLIATAQKERAKADFGIMNSGGIRASIETGKITYKDVLKVQPFANTICYMEMTGKELVEYLNTVAMFPTDTGAYAQFSGISFSTSEAGVSDIKIDGKELIQDKEYRFSIPSFNADGGDGYPKLSDKKGFVNTKFVDAEVLKSYLENNSPIDTSAYKLYK